MEGFLCEDENDKQLFKICCNYIDDMIFADKYTLYIGHLNYGPLFDAKSKEIEEKYDVNIELYYMIKYICMQKEMNTAYYQLSKYMELYFHEYYKDILNILSLNNINIYVENIFKLYNGQSKYVKQDYILLSLYIYYGGYKYICGEIKYIGHDTDIINHLSYKINQYYLKLKTIYLAKKNKLPIKLPIELINFIYDEYIEL